MFFFSVLTILVCILLVLVILVQNSKGGGIQSQYNTATQIMGVRRGTEFIEKATWSLAIALIVLSVLMTPKNTVMSENAGGSKTKARAGSSVAPQQPSAGTPQGALPPQGVKPSAVDQQPH